MGDPSEQGNPTYHVSWAVHELGTGPGFLIEGGKLRPGEFTRLIVALNDLLDEVWLLV